MSSDQNTSNPNLPLWLRGVPLPPRPAAPSAPVGPPPAAAALPEWLRDLGDDQPAAAQPASPAEPLPDWLSSLPEPSAQPGAAEPLPDWLRDLSGPGDPTPESQAELPSDVPDWLRETQSALAPEPAPDFPSAPAPAEALPSWLLDDAGPTEPPAAEPPAEPSSFTPFSFDDTSSAPTQPPADALPSWLAGEQPSPAAEPAGITPFSFDDTSSAPPAERSWLAQDLGTSGDSIPDWLGSTQPAEQQPTEPEQPSQPLWMQDRLAVPSEPAAPQPPAGDLPDWLRDTSAGQPPEPAAPQPPTGDLPDWLRDTSAGQPPEPQAPQPPTGDLPDWLRDTSAGQPLAPEQLPSWLSDANRPAAPATEEIPSWLSDTANPPAATEPPEQQPSWMSEPTGGEPPGAQEELPSWLSDTANAPAATEPPEQQPSWMSEPTGGEPPGAQEELPSWLSDANRPAAPATEEIPSWLSDATSAPAAPEQPEPAPSSPPAEGDDLPTWLRSMPTGPASAAPAPPAEDLPAWLRPTEPPPQASLPAEASVRPSEAAANPPEDLPPWLSDEHGQPLPTAGAPGDSNLPSWLRGASAGPPAPPPDEPAPPAPAAEAARAKTPTTELVGGIELPVWLRPTESEAPKEINPTDARALDWLTRLGPAEDEPENAPAPALKLAPPAAPTRSSAQLSAIALLEQLAATPYPEPAAEPAPAAQPAWRRLRPELLGYLALIAGLIAGLLTPAPALLGLNTQPSALGADALFSQIDGLSPDDTVLVGYEWDARRSSELRPLERAVLDHLIQRRVKLVLVSTDPQGSLLLYDLRDRLEQAGYQPRGEDYILLGYKPGAELALRTIAQSFPSTLRSDFQGNDASGSILATDANRQLRLRSIADFSMVLVLTDDASDVQGWMEQVHPSAGRADGSSVPFGFLMPAETAPIVQPYLSQANVTHLDGRQGALAYQQLRGDSGLPAAQVAAEAGQQRLGTLAYLALLLIGALGVGVYSAAMRGRKRA